MWKQHSLFPHSLFITHTGSILEAIDAAPSSLKILSAKAYVLSCVETGRRELPVPEKETEYIDRNTLLLWYFLYETLFCNAHKRCVLKIFFKNTDFCCLHYNFLSEASTSSREHWADFLLQHSTNGNQNVLILYALTQVLSPQQTRGKTKYYLNLGINTPSCYLHDFQPVWT